MQFSLLQVFAVNLKVVLKKRSTNSFCGIGASLHRYRVETLAFVLVTTKIGTGDQTGGWVSRLILKYGENELHSTFREYVAFAEVVSILNGGRFVFPVIAGFTGSFHGRVFYWLVNA